VQPGAPDLQVLVGAVLVAAVDGVLALLPNDVPTQIHLLHDVTISGLADKDVLRYNGGSGRWENHQLTTASIGNIDETSRADGSVLVYSQGNARYEATNTLEKQIVRGGAY